MISWANLGKIWAKVIRFGRNQSLSFLKTSALLNGNDYNALSLKQYSATICKVKGLVQ